MSTSDGTIWQMMIICHQ